jgi:acyl carrier protein
MGLDAVEVVMEVEDTFDICLEDAEAEKILTPQHLIDLVQAKVARVEPSVCLSQRAFNFLRRYLIEHRALPRARITTKARLSTLIPRAQRKLFLQQLAADIGAGSPPPGLVRPVWLKRWLAALCLAFGTYVGFTYGADLENAFVILLFVAGGSAWVGLVATKLFRTDFPMELATVGDLALWVRRHKADLANCSQKGWTREQIASRVREIVVEKLDCAASYREDASFIKDLGLS